LIGRVGSAVANWRRRRVAWEKHRAAWEQKGRREFNAANWTAALDALSHISPSSSTVWAIRGACLYHLDELAEAVQCLERALDFDRHNVFALYYRGMCALRAGHFFDAEWCLIQATAASGMIRGNADENFKNISEKASIKLYELWMATNIDPILIRRPLFRNYVVSMAVNLFLVLIAIFLVEGIKSLIDIPPNLEAWTRGIQTLVALSLYLLIFIGPLVIMWTTKYEFFNNRMIVSHGFLWTSTTPIDWVIVRTPQLRQSLSDYLLSISRINIKLDRDLEVYDRMGRYATANEVHIPALMENDQMKRLVLYMSARCAWAKMTIHQPTTPSELQNVVRSA